MGERSNLGIAVGIGVIAGFLIAVGNLYWKLAETQTELSNLRSSVQGEIIKLADATHKAANRNQPAAEPNRKLVDSLKQELAEQLDSAKTQAFAAAQHAREAMNQATLLAAKLGEDTLNQHREVIGQLGQIKEREADTTARITDVSADVASIKTDVTNTRQELQQTVSALKQVTGDLGVQSGFIATNAKELQALKTLGERNYFDFHIERSGKPQRVAGVSLILKKTDIKRSRYTLQVVTDDQKTEKKEKTINEPVQFYVSKSRIPFEIVVNEVQKDYVVGYLATPKESVTRND